MSKIKKILAVLVTLAMVMAMSVTAFADGPSATITVNNLDSATSISYLQIIEPDQSTETGWTFVNGAYDQFKAVTSLGSLTDQQIIWKMIKYADNTATNIPVDTVAITAAELQAAMKNVDTHLGAKYVTTGVSNNAITVSKAGVYAIKAIDTEFYVYTPMAAYVSFGNYDTTTGVPSSLVNATVNAKRTRLDIEKTNDQADGVVEIGKTVTYTVNTNIPYFADDIPDASVLYQITDTIDGASYVLNTDNKVDVTVQIGTASSVVKSVAVTKSSDNKDQIIIDLSEYAKNRANANAPVVITYSAMVTGEIVGNSVVPGDGSHEFVPKTNTLYTGKITMTKTGKNQEKLANAGFVVYRMFTVVNGDETNLVKKYALVTKDTTKTTSNEYVLTGWTESLETAKEENNLIMTDANGEAVVRGLDDSYNDYTFQEVKAPEGYSINTNDSVAVWGDNQTAENRTGTASMTDTKLNALPSTGGIGTTIFTVGGCLIMIAAAALFFVSRRKASNK